MSVRWHENQFFVLRALQIGKTKQEIADALCVGRGAIYMLLSRLYKEHGVKNEDELLDLYFKDEQRQGQ